ncbi:lysophospholipid acyltransferase family protein [Exiguobacterium aurantiacum]|uniref:1-acyl-sn-glycerol-3-phosphate acyltransferase n=1 Tax=Exiguobacterium aurantiacum TaxID=33987 RepID=A0A377FWT7_9BACL|nr:lysophospholipid acyltransferase family protein [Exiguobacterium aurantiacum]STO09034.1 1-acyl-sn-glycerol-3-phosphate acyltransferase [Exiguobacterium aurantiacum]
MIRTAVWFFSFFAVLPVTLPFMNKAKKLETPERYGYVQGVAYKWASFLLKVAGAEVRVHGQQHIPNEPVVYVANHQGNFDVPIMITATKHPKAFISKIEVQKFPIIPRWMELMGCIFIDRSDRRQSIKAIRSGVDTIKSGQSIIIFPEGTRSKGGPIKEFKAGSLTLATSSGAKIVPVAIQGSHHLLETTNRIKPGVVDVTFLPAIDPADIPNKEIAATVEAAIRQIVEGELS